MSRIRTVKPELFKHDGLYDLESETGLPIRLSFIGLFTVADREGRFKWRPRTLKPDILPFDNIDFSHVLDALATRGFIVKYEINGEFFGLIPKFKDHQFINGREAESILPEPSKSAICGVKFDASTTREPRVPHVTHGEGKGKEGKGKERKDIGLSAEPKKIFDSTLPAIVEKTFIEIPLVGKGQSYQVTETQVEEFSKYYPGVDIKQQLRECAAWNMSNPSNRKTQSGILRHINAWLSKAQNSSIPRALIAKQQGTFATPRKMTALEQYHAHKEKRDADARGSVVGEVINGTLEKD